MIVADINLLVHAYKQDAREHVGALLPVQIAKRVDDTHTVDLSFVLEIF